MSSSCGAPHSKFRSKQLQSSASVTGELVGEEVIGVEVGLDVDVE